MPDNAFSGFTKLREIVLPDRITSVGESTFLGCNNLVLTTLLASLIFIGERAFYKCESLALETFPSVLEHVGDSAFEGCDSLALKALPASLSSIGKAVFRNCSGLHNLTIPGSVFNVFEGVNVSFCVDVAVLDLSGCSFTSLCSDFDCGISDHAPGTLDDIFCGSMGIGGACNYSDPSLLSSLITLSLC
ncbi:MAG: leucine-rich repeat domain-containing protein [Holosporales bacterium]|nr:leucine-rich repeat domain-containing protein [Holosporales bacterium]